MKPEELKPCPFCGYHAKFSESGEDSGIYIVFCLKCWCQTNEFYSKEEAGKAWNTRQEEGR